MTLVDFSTLIGRGVLAATFLVAGLAKLTSRESSERALRDFGAPRFVLPLAPLLPWLEMTVAAGLLFAVATAPAATLALALLLVFSGGIAANLMRGRQPVCNCFGQLHTAPISGWTLVRNCLLTTCALWLVVNGPPPPTADLWVLLGQLDSRGRRIAIVVTILIAALLLYALRTPADESPTFHSRATSADTLTPVQSASGGSSPGKVLTGVGLPVGAPAPGFELPDIQGRAWSLDALRAAGAPVVLVFSSPHCQACQALAPRLPALAVQHAGQLRLVLISHEPHATTLQDPGALVVLLQPDYEVSEAYNCTSNPAAVAIDAAGLIHSELAVGAPAIERLITATAEPASAREQSGAAHFE